MQTAEEGKAPLFATQPFYILMDFGACDCTIYKLHKHNTHRYQKNSLITFTFHLACLVRNVFM